MFSLALPQTDAWYTYTARPDTVKRIPLLTLRHSKPAQSLRERCQRTSTPPTARETLPYSLYGATASTSLPSVHSYEARQVDQIGPCCETFPLTYAILGVPRWSPTADSFCSRHCCVASGGGRVHKSTH